MSELYRHKKYNKYLFTARQITDGYFDDPEPNNQHVLSIRISQSNRTVFIRGENPYFGKNVGGVGDWIIRAQNGKLFILSNPVFCEIFKKDVK